MRRFQSGANQVQISFGRGHAACRLLLKNVQHKDSGGESHRVDCSIGIAAPIFDNLQHSGRSEPFERLGLLVLATDLRLVESVAKNVNDLAGKGQQILFAAANPVQRSRGTLHGLRTLYLNRYKGKEHS